MDTPDRIPQQAAGISEFSAGRKQSSNNLQTPEQLSGHEPEVFEEKTVTSPSWREGLTLGLKVAGLSLGATVCGALAVGLLPLTIIGGIVWLSGVTANSSHMGHQNVVEEMAPVETKEVKESREWRSRMELAGKVLAAPAFGLIACIREIENLPYDDEKYNYKQNVKFAAQLAIGMAGKEGNHANLSNFHGWIKNEEMLKKRDLEEMYNFVLKLSPSQVVTGFERNSSSYNLASRVKDAVEVRKEMLKKLDDEIKNR